MRETRIAIAGGGLAGLYAAWLLERAGLHDYVLFEAREVLGGRILSAPVGGPADRVDLGPTWFWPALQPQLDRLVDELGLERFAQYETGDAMVERADGGPPLRVRGYVNEPASMRLAGGMQSLTEALRRRLPGPRILTGHALRRLDCTGADIGIELEDGAGRSLAWRAAHLLLALPPRLAAGTIAYAPALPPQVLRAWAATPTWMAPHAKYVAVYETPFWRASGLSGEARSARGPMAEIHDASMPGASAALFGFVGLPARVRAGIGDEVLRAQCRAQLVRLFGPQAAAPRAEYIKDWAADPHTAVPADLGAAHAHAAAPIAVIGDGPWAGRLTGIASEWSRPFPGYLAGAVDAAAVGVDALARRLSR